MRIIELLNYEIILLLNDFRYKGQNNFSYSSLDFLNPIIGQMLSSLFLVNIDANFCFSLINEKLYRWDLEKQERCGVVAHEWLTEPRVTMKWLLVKPRSVSNLPAF